MGDSHIHVSKKWRDCIVTYIDMAGVKDRIKPGAASRLMRRLHGVVFKELRIGFPTIEYAYVWNDSVLLLSYVQQTDQSFEAALRDTELLKRKIDTVGRSFAIAVKGRAFARSRSERTLGHAPRVTILRTSSWAMANCFEVQEKLKHHRATWYVDGRISKRIRTTRKCKRFRVSMLPSRKRRYVCTFNGYLWD